MVTKFALVVSLCVALMGLSPMVAAQDWQSAELVDEIRRTDDAMWVHEGASPVVQQDSSLLETQAQVGVAAGTGVDLVAELASRVKAALAAEIRQEVASQVEAHAASWSPSFRFSSDASAFLEKEESTAAAVTKDDTIAAAAAAAASAATTQAAVTAATAAPNASNPAANPASTTTPVPPALDAAPPANASTQPPPVVATEAAHPLCKALVCYNGGFCNSMGTCTCPAETMGVRCETKITCNKSTCVNGSCEGNVCVCKPGSGFTGERCDKDTGDRCFGVACLNGGECQKATGACQCFGNFKGDRCEVKPAIGEECANVQCKNGGTCKAPGFCNCVNGFSGKYCEVDPCAGVICHNSGKCESGICACVNGFFGKRCEKDPCALKKCLNGGVCQNNECRCFNEWRGTMCEISMKTPADPNTPVPKVPAYDSCICDVPGSAVSCDTLPDRKCANGTLAIVRHVPETISFAGVNRKYPCHTLPCRNGGKCRKGKCVCEFGFDGLLCEIDKCADKECKNGGVCNKGRCHCNFGFEGEHCEIDKCEGVSCLNGGVCVPGGKCRCPADFRGRFCQLRSPFGNKRHTINRRLDRFISSSSDVDNSLNRVAEIMNPERIKSDIKEMTDMTVESLETQELDLDENQSNSVSFEKKRGAGPKDFSNAGPRLRADDKGKVEWHNRRTNEEIEAAVKQIEAPVTQELRTDKRSIELASKLNTDAFSNHTELPKVIDRLEAMAFVESGSDADVDADADADVDVDVDADADVDVDAEGEVDVDAEEEVEADFF